MAPLYDHAQILSVVNSYTDLTDGQVLTIYRKWRDQLVIAGANNASTVHLEVRNRRLQVSDPADLLDKLEDLIDRYEQKLNKGGMARNIARTHKPA